MNNLHNPEKGVETVKTRQAGQKIRKEGYGKQADRPASEKLFHCHEYYWTFHLERWINIMVR